MPKMRHFFEKRWKIAEALELRAQTPVGLGGWGSAPNPMLLLSYTVATFYKRTNLVLTRFIIKDQMRLISSSNSTLVYSFWW